MNNKQLKVDLVHRQIMKILNKAKLTVAEEVALLESMKINILIDGKVINVKEFPYKK